MAPCFLLAGLQFSAKDLLDKWEIRSSLMKAATRPSVLKIPAAIKEAIQLVLEVTREQAQVLGEVAIVEVPVG